MKQFTHNKPISQIPQYIKQISHNAKLIMRCSWSYYVIYTGWGRMQSLYSCKEKLPREYVNSKGRARNREQYNTWCTYNGRSWEHTHYSSLTRFTFWWRRHNSLEKTFWDNHYAGVWKVVSNSLDIDCLHGDTRCRLCDLCQDEHGVNDRYPWRAISIFPYCVSPVNFKLLFR